MPAAADFASFQAELARLVEVFGRNLSHYKSADYDEASLRNEFLNPFFRALGWDVENLAGDIPKHREVEIESRTQIGGRQKRADFLFRTETRGKFVCEAKKPAEELHARSAFQAKRYAWNKGLPLAVLTDFEEFKIYVVGGKPYADEPQVGVRPHGRGAVIEEKPEVRKAGGVYYTPSYIVEYIVGQTVGKLLDEISGGRATLPRSRDQNEVSAPRERRPTTAKEFERRTNALRILDPACGSGNFLLGAFDRVCQHWQTWLTEDFRRSRGDETQTDKDRQRLLASSPAAAQAAWEKRHRKWCWVDKIREEVVEPGGAKKEIVRETVNLTVSLSAEFQKKFSKTFAHLQQNSGRLRERKQFKEWFGYSAPRNLELHERAQIAVPLLADGGLFALIPRSSRGTLCPMASGGFTVTLSEECAFKPEFVLGILNSKLAFWFLQQISNVFRGGWITCTKQYFGELPIVRLDLRQPADKARHNKLVLLVDKMLGLMPTLRAATSDSEKATLQNAVTATDQQIDQLVYELYGLTPEEIALVEGNA